MPLFFCPYIEYNKGYITIKIGGGTKMFVYNISFEVASSAFLVILYIYTRLQYSHTSQVNKEFERLTLYVLAANVVDVVAAITLTYALVLPRWVNLVTNSAYYVLAAFLGYQFTVYSRACVNRRKAELLKEEEGSGKERNYMGIINRFLMFLFFGVFVVNLFTGIIFSIGENGEYLHGPLYYSVYVLSYYYIMCSGFIMFRNYKLFEKRQLISMLIYIVIAFAGPILQMVFFKDVLLAVFSSALGLVMMLFSMETPDYQKLVKTMEQLEQAQKRAEEASQAKSRFLANMSHEVRTPVNAMLGYNQMILDEARDGQIQEYARNVQAAGKNLISMFHDILDFTNMDTGSITLCKEPYMTEAFLQDLVTYTFFDTQKKNLKLQLHIDENLPKELSGDMSRLMQIMNNLISNAVKYTVEGFVSIRITWKGIDEFKGTFRVEIADSGVGIKAEDFPEIIRRFSRMDGERTHYIQGIGLGLSIVTKLLELMGSKLEIESEYQKGSKFSFEIQQRIVDNTPIGKVDWGKHATQLHTCAKNTGCPDKSFESSCQLQEKQKESHLLIVDENAMNLRLAKNIFQKKFQVHVAKSAKEAFAFLQDCLPDLILLDIHIPDMDGLEVIRTLQRHERYRDIPIVFLIADDDIDGEKRGLEAGAFDFIKKPLVEEVAIHRIQHILQLSHFQKKCKKET